MAGPLNVVGGVDPHADTIHVAVITMTGKAVADREFATTADGYGSATAFLTASGAVVRVGVEGAASYGAGFTRALKTAGIDVVDVDRPARFDRRRAGKSDRLDAYHAARAVLAGRSNPVKGHAIEGVRALHLARRSAVKAQTAAMNQMIAILVMAPDPVRARYRRLRGDRLAIALTRSRSALDPVSADTLLALKALADRYRQLAVQVDALTTRLDHAVRQASPALRAAFGVGPDTAAQLLITAGSNPERLYSERSFAALCGSAPVQASSGKTHRHRLSRGGDRAANSALHRIALVRMANHPPTRAYVARQTANGRSKREIIRMLKRAIAREIYRLLTHPAEVPNYADLRAVRQAKNITVTLAARHFDVWPAVISRLERGLRRDDDLARQYRTWLAAA
jgi:transposase